MTARRHFGNVRKLPSGRYQASYWHAGARHTADHTFPAKADAQAWLSNVETSIRNGGWVDPAGGRLTLEEYARRFMAQRTDLRASTAAKYEGLLRLHILPRFGNTKMGDLTPSAVRAWWADLHSRRPATAAGAYRLLSTICNTAVRDRIIIATPCTVTGGGVERSPERPTASIPEVAAAIEAMPAGWKAAVALAAWCQLRRSEVLGLQRRDVDLLRRSVRVERAYTAYPDGTAAITPPKTEAGIRTVSIPTNVVGILEEHLAGVSGDPAAWLFPGADPAVPARHMTLGRAWAAARKAIGRPELHFHDLRHSGLTWSAASGASVAELMRRAGHRHPSAAMRYQHATDDRDQALADALAGLAEKAPVVPLRTATRDASRT